MNDYKVVCSCGESVLPDTVRRSWGRRTVSSGLCSNGHINYWL